jgi:anthranilate phosphoribosyltransferase
MSFDPEVLRDFGGAIQKLIQGVSLDRRECYSYFSQILKNEQPDLHQGAFLAALVSKGETAEEIAGVWQAIDELDTVHPPLPWQGPLMENCGTGMDQLKTFNVSSAAAVVAAAGGVKIARHGARALTSLCGTVDLMEKVGIDVECEPETVVRSVVEAGIGLFNGMSPKVHPQALGRILSQIRFGSTLNIAASLAHPLRPDCAVRGVYAADCLDKVCAVMRQVGYRRGLVVYGWDLEKQRGMDEISILGETEVREFGPDGRLREYTLRPEEFGVQPVMLEAIAGSGNLEREAERFLQVLAGLNHQACSDFTCLNAGAVLYIAGITPTLQEGVEHSREIIHQGQAIKKMEEWVSLQQDPDHRGQQRFESLARKAGVDLSS